MIYLVYCETTDENYVISAHQNLESANEYAKKSIKDTWRVQDGFEYKTHVRENGTKCYSLEPYYTYYVEKIELKE